MHLPHKSGVALKGRAWYNPFITAERKINVRAIDGKGLKALFADAAARNAFHGAVGVYEGGRAVYEYAAGLADFDAGRPLSTDSLFDLASVTKQFTASAVMLLWQRGKLSPGDSLQKYYPKVPYPGVTLEMLLNHTGGLPDEDWCVQFLGRTDRPASNADLIEILENQPAAPLFRPGGGWAYSNIAYELAASIVEKTADCGFEDFLKRELFAPAGMEATTVYHRYAGAPVPEGFADSRVIENGNLARPDASAGARFIIPLEGVNGAGLVYTNVGDMCRWDTALRGGRLLNEAAQARMRMPVDTGTGEQYGLGWFIAEGGALMRHGGFWPGYVNEFSRWPEAGRTLVILTNLTRDQRAMDSLAECARALVAGREAPRFETTLDRMDASVSSKSMEALAGRYAPGEARFHDGALYFTWGDGVDLPLIPVGENLFQSPADRNDYIFSEGALTVRNRRGGRRLTKA